MDRSRFYDYADGSAYAGLSTKATFSAIASARSWESKASISGYGSSNKQTRKLVAELPGIFYDLDIKTVLDIPCGDFSWMSEVAASCPDIEFIAADIVLSKVLEIGRYNSVNNVRFITMNLLTDDLPKADLILCRDCLVHFSFEDIGRASNNLLRNGVKYLLTTTFSEEKTNHDIITGGWRPINLELSPFNLPPPRLLLNESCTEGDGLFADKSLGLWLFE